MIALALAMAMLAADTPATSDTAKAAPASAKGAAVNKDGLVCKKEAVLGSRMKTRVCLTQAEWDQRTADAKDLTSEAQRGKVLTQQ